jgi:hypothetical protein
MASKRHVRRRQTQQRALLRERACTGKARHADNLGAWLARRQLARRFGTCTLDIYKCQFCEGWHLGN